MPKRTHRIDEITRSSRGMSLRMLPMALAIPALLASMLPLPPSLRASSVAQLDGADTSVVCIEEDWELNMLTPAPEFAAPQVGTVMASSQDLNDLHVVFMLNHRYNPSYAPGGMGLQLWQQEQQLGWTSFDSKLLSNSNEQVSWTQRLEIQDGRLCFELKDGASSTWGSFGNGEAFRLSGPTKLSDLSAYRSEVSVKNSGVTFGSQRVASLVLKAVRGYSSAGELILEQSDPITVFAASPDSAAEDIAR